MFFVKILNKKVLKKCLSSGATSIDRQERNATHHFKPGPNGHNTTKEKEREYWLDLLRFIAIFMVICIHCADPFNISPEARANPDIIFGAVCTAHFSGPVYLFL